MSATLGQVGKVLRMLEGVPDDRFQQLLESGLLSDLLKCDIPTLVDRGKFQELIRGEFTVVINCNCDTSPFTPEGWQVVKHRKNGQLELGPKKVVFHLSDVQKKGGVISGNDLRKLLANEPVLNANVLDYLLANPHLIPEEWKSKYVFFWGTIYRHSDGSLCVRYLRWYGEWHWHEKCLNCVLDFDDLAVLFVD